MKRVLTVVGARPQFVKAATVSRAIRSMDRIDEYIVHTGQHYDSNMSAVFFDQLGIPEPRWNLGLGGGTHGMQTGRMVGALETIMQESLPDRVLVYGDTNSTLAAALSAAKLNIPVAHVEAGLRSFNRRMPEEINRVIADHLSDLLFAPTEVAVDNLAREGIAGSAVKLVGDVMLDAIRYYNQSIDCAAIRRGLDVEDGHYALVTIHRPENTDNADRLRAIVQGLAAAARELAIIFPIHPRTRAALVRHGLDDVASSAIRLVEPVDYLTMLALEQGAALIVTDSGGVQKEAFLCGVPCLTLRDETEWTELVDCGWNVVCPPISADAVTGAILGRLDSAPAEKPDLYGNGNAAFAIADCLSA